MRARANVQTSFGAGVHGIQVTLCLSTSDQRDGTRELVLYSLDEVAEARDVLQGVLDGFGSMGMPAGGRDDLRTDPE